MQITDPFNNPRLLIEQTKADVLQQLRPGQSLQARVAAPTQQGSVLLQIGGSQIKANTQLQLNVGDKLLISVVKGGAKPELMVVREPNIKALQAQLLKAILPKQLPVERLVAGLQHISRPQASPSAAASQPPLANRVDQASLVKLFNQLAASLPGSEKLLQSAQPTAGSRATPLQQLQQLHTALTSGPDSAVKGSDKQALANRIHEFLGLTPNQQSPITPKQLQQALGQSGLFLEASLAAGVAPQQDMKVALLKLLAQLNVQLGPELLQLASTGARQDASPGEALQAMAARFFAELQAQAEGSLARIQMHQLASLPEEGQKQVWQFELPVRHNEGTDGFQIRLERERRPGEHGEEDIWNVTLDFDIEPAGAISAKLTLVEETISSSFMAERAESVARVEQQLPRLNEAFLRAGLKVGSLSARQESAPATADRTRSPFPLLDEKA